MNNQFVAQPTRVQGSLVFKQIVAVKDLTCAITIPGQLYCWGRELVQGPNPQAITSPRLIEGGIAFESIAVFGAEICGISAGRAYCRGTYPGDGSTFSPGFVQVVPPGNSPSANYVRVAVGSSFRCLLTSEGLPSCWGADTGSGRGANSTLAPLPLSRPLVVAQPF